MQETYLFHVSGIHCKACRMLIEDELKDKAGITAAKVSLKNHQVEITGDFSDQTPEDIIEKLQPYMKKMGYTLSREKKRNIIAWREFFYAIPFAAVFLALFILLQKSGLVDLVSTKNMSYPTAFVIGSIASVSTCMAVVGGLTLSISANFAKEGDKVVPQLLFHAGRLASFFLLGGILGALGAQIEMGQGGTLVLSIVVSLVMLVLGINLLDLFPFAKKLQPALPHFISAHLLEVKKINHTLTPALMGLATFFLPCGFTQSMQLYSLSTGSFMTGGLTMLVFAFGTLPVLSLLSFASLSLHSRLASGVFFKTSGLIVIGFALFNLTNAAAAAGIVVPPGAQVQRATDAGATSNNVHMENGRQIIYIYAKEGYRPSLSFARADRPSVLRLVTSDTYDCSSVFVIPDLNYRTRLPMNGTTEVEIPPQAATTRLTGLCGMGMYSFNIHFFSG